ncbi:MAG: alpha/beta hydrolase [Acetobacteraceae bacterium]
MAKDLADLMEQLGFATYRIGAHDRGARVAHRLALDYPDRVVKLAVLDIVPTIEHFERADMSFALGYYHWFWFAQPHPLPEDLINKSPDTWFNAHTGGVPGAPAFFVPEALEDYLAAAHDPAAIIGMCEDYRAAATIDLVHDRMSRSEGRQVQCRCWCCGAPRARSAAGTTRSRCGGNTASSSRWAAAWIAGTSSPRKRRRRRWSGSSGSSPRRGRFRACWRRRGACRTRRNEALLNRPGLRAVIAGDIRDAISGYCGNQRALDAARA